MFFILSGSGFWSSIANGVFVIIGVLLGHFLTKLPGKIKIRKLQCERIEVFNNPIAYRFYQVTFTMRMFIYNQSDKYSTLGSIEVLVEKFGGKIIRNNLDYQLNRESFERPLYTELSNLVLSPRQIYEQYFSFNLIFDDADYESLFSSIKKIKIKYLNDHGKPEYFNMSFHDFVRGVEVEKK